MNTTGRLTLEKVTRDIISLDQTFFPTPWTIQNWEELNTDTHSIYGWKVDDRLVGFALLLALEGDAAAHLFKMLLHENERGGGSSVLFWSGIRDSLKARGFSLVYLEVEVNNLRAQGFYKKVGFRLLRRIKSYYSSGEDALTMSLVL
jgi:ribosomal-protein-alanine N-acetyltransferase